MNIMSGLFLRFLTLILTATAIGVTLVLMAVGYQIAIWVMENGYTHGQLSMVALGGIPSLCSLLSLPFWMTLWRLRS